MRMASRTVHCKHSVQSAVGVMDAMRMASSTVNCKHIVEGIFGAGVTRDSWILTQGSRSKSGQGFHTEARAPATSPNLSRTPGHKVRAHNSPSLYGVPLHARTRHTHAPPY
eukprot:1161198-Pelagomonas_calceolata.AAC.4